MMTVSTAQQLQQLFGQAAALPFNAVSKGVFTALHTCHTAANGAHTYRCNDAVAITCITSTIAVATGIVPTAVA